MDVWSLRQRNVPRYVQPPAPRRQTGPTPVLTPHDPLGGSDSEDNNFGKFSSSPPQLVPVVDIDSFLDVGQLVSDVATGQFSTDRLELSSVPPSPPTPYQSPTWFAAFVADFLTQQNLERLAHTAHKPILNSTVVVGQPILTAAGILTARYYSERQLLLTVSEERYGAAYTLYTRYRVLNRIAADIGLDINKPTKTVSVDGVHIEYGDLFQWAALNARTFTNSKSLIIHSEFRREELSQLATRTPAQQISLGHLNALAQDPAEGLRPPSWSIAALRRHIFGEPHGPRARR
ncbi:hypothetical protein C8R45DRAFT_1209010 [Mycena sanguinolenta]|nr:hypothetical protein C8R45DRAFT_1209010 [Mycena sanguinolenta]